MQQLARIGALWMGVPAIGMTAQGTTAQGTVGKQVVCGMFGCLGIVIPKPRHSKASAFSVQQVWIVVDSILAVPGLLPSFQVVGTDGVDNAAAIIIIIEGQPQRLTGLSIRNGHAKSDRIYTHNNRVRRLRISASNGKRIGLVLKDIAEWQVTDVLADLGKVSWIKLEIEQVYPGSQYQDTALTEVRVQ